MRSVMVITIQVNSHLQVLYICQIFNQKGLVVVGSVDSS